MTEYERWLSVELDDPDLKEELLSVKDQPEEINDRFYRDLAFGTGGLRGVIGAGTNRMNVYTVRKATQGLANYLNKHNTEGKPLSVAIAHDSRNKGVLFSKESAAVLAANGIKAYLYPQLMPTPALSFAVRHLHCDAGICVTASHNPAIYNGIKVFTEGGRDASAQQTDEIEKYIARIEHEEVKSMEYDKALEAGLIQEIYPLNEYLDNIIDNIDMQAIRNSRLKIAVPSISSTKSRCRPKVMKSSPCIQPSGKGLLRNRSVHCCMAISPWRLVGRGGNSWRKAGTNIP
mgnify:CR=1 FL=1